MLKRPRSIYAGKTVKTSSGETIRIEDYWENVNGRSWKIVKGNHSVGIYKKRIKKNMLPEDNEVLYGKIGSIGLIIHVTEIIGEINE